MTMCRKVGALQAEGMVAGSAATVFRGDESKRLGMEYLDNPEGPSGSI